MLKLAVDSFDTLPNDLQPFYRKQSDGSAVLDAEDVSTAMTRERQRADKYIDVVLRSCMAANVEPTLMLPILRPSLKVQEEQGGFVVRVIDARGNVRIGDAGGGAMTTDQYLEELRSDPQYAGAFRERESDSGKKNARGNVRTIDGKDQQAFLRNLSAIAKGEVVVQSA